MTQGCPWMMPRVLCVTPLLLQWSMQCLVEEDDTSGMYVTSYSVTLIIIIVQTYLKTLNNACQIYFVECVSKIRHILSVIHYTIRGAVCLQFTHFHCGDWENIYTLLHYRHQIGSMNCYPLFRVRSWNNAVRCMSFCILMRLHYIDGLVQDGGNCIANALELRTSCTKPSLRYCQNCLHST